MHGSRPLVLLIIVLIFVILIVASDIDQIHFDGHVLCRIGNGTAKVPVKNAEVKLLEEDPCWFGFDCDDPLASAKTDAEGAFNLDGKSLEVDGFEPYLLIKTCRDESSCYVKRFTDSENRANVTNGNYFMDDEFCQHCKGGGECQSA